MRFPDFPDDWKETTLGEICSVLGGGTPRTEIQEYWNGDIQWFTPSEIGLNKFVSYSDRTITTEGLNNSGAKLLPIGTILLTTRATIGEMSIATTPCSTNQGFQSLVADSRYTTTEFIYQKVKTLKNELFTRANGSTFKEISATEIRSLALSLPSLTEQKRIADFLSLIDERITNLSETIRELKNQKAALLNQLFSQKLRFPDFNDEWTQCFVSDFGQVVTGSTPPTSDSCNYDASDYLWASPSDLGQTKYIRKTKTMLSSKGFSLTRSLPLGSVLVSCIGIIGKVGVAVTEMSTNQQINAIIPNQSKVNSEYVYYAILNKSLAYGRLSATQVVPILSKREFERMRNQYPTLAEQKKIADFLSLIDERIEVEEQLLKKYEEQKKYLLRNMFV